MNKRLNISIVLFKPDIIQLKKCLDSIEMDSEYVDTVYLIDNDFFDMNKIRSYQFKIKHISNEINLGFGTAHNIGINKSISSNIDYHLVLNPDIFFKKKIFKQIISFMDSNSNVSNLMPNILNEDGSNQELSKLLPSPKDKFYRFFSIQNSSNYILKNLDKNKVYNIPSLSGCFMFLRTNSMKEIGLFDENFFLYEEDLDLSRRIYTHSKNIYYPLISVYHSFNRSSFKHLSIKILHIKSIIKYFNKYGWFFDKNRKIINNYFINKYYKNKLNNNQNKTL